MADAVKLVSITCDGLASQRLYALDDKSRLWIGKPTDDGIQWHPQPIAGPVEPVATAARVRPRK